MFTNDIPDLKMLITMGLALTPAPAEHFINTDLTEKKTKHHQFEATKKRQQEKPFNTNLYHAPKPHNQKSSGLMQRNSRKG